jgi:O-acetylserine/cysteine efflux transporter
MSEALPPPLAWRTAATLVLIAFMWGSNNVAAHVVGQESHPLVAGGLRFIITALLLLPWLKVPKHHRRSVLLIATIAGPVHFGLLYMGISLSHNIGALAVVMQMWVPVSTLLAIVLLREYPTRQQVVGLGLALLGIGVMCFDPHLIDDAPAAFLCFCATLCWSLTMVLTRRAAVISGLSLQAWMAALTGPTLFFVGAMAQPVDLATIMHFTPRYWLLTLYGAIGSGVIGNVLVFNIVRRHSVAQTTPLLLSMPVFAMICGTIFLQEQFGLQEICGAALVLAAIVVIVRRRAAVVVS